MSRRRKIERQNPTSMPSEYQLENGEQNHYQEVDEAQTTIPPQVVVPVYDHVNLNSTREVSIVTLLIVVHKDETIVYNTAEILYW